MITQAAQILYGTRWLLDYPQGILKLGRFCGAGITGDILNNKQEHMHAFAMVRGAMAWLDRTLPLAARDVVRSLVAWPGLDRMDVAAHRALCIGAVSRADLTKRADADWGNSRRRGQLDETRAGESEIVTK